MAPRRVHADAAPPSLSLRRVMAPGLAGAGAVDYASILIAAIASQLIMRHCDAAFQLRFRSSRLIAARYSAAVAATPGSHGYAAALSHARLLRHIFQSLLKATLDIFYRLHYRFLLAIWLVCQPAPAEQVRRSLLRHGRGRQRCRVAAFDTIATGTVTVTSRSQGGKIARHC